MNIVLLLLGILAFAVIIFLLVSSVTVEFRLKEGKPLQQIDIKQMERLKRGLFTIYFSFGHRSLAEEVLNVLEHAWRIVQERFAIDLGRFGVALVVPKEGEDLGGVVLTRKIWALWDQIWPVLTPPGLQSFHDADRDTLIFVYWGMVHEAMEMKIAKRLYYDRAARWIGDGLAEYMGYTITSELAPTVRDEMLSIRRRNIQLGLIDQGHSRYDLTKEFLVKRGEKKGEASEQKPIEGISDPGYAVSLAFWLQIAQQHGEGVIKEFWQRLSQKGFPNAQEAARILSELTGEDIWTKLQNMDLNKVLQTLERAAGVP